MESRAHAALGRYQETHAALGRAEIALARLDPGSVIASAFGYSKAQLRFHQSNVQTHMRDTTAAWQVQERALALYPSSDYLDRTLTRLDRASCLVHTGDIPDAVTYMTETLDGLTQQQRCGIILLRARDIIATLPTPDRARSSVRELRDRLRPPSATKG